MTRKKMGGAEVKVIDRGWDVKVAQWLKEPGSRDLQVGIFDPTAGQRALWAEYGTATQPPRPVMTMVLNANANLIEQHQRKVAEELADGTGKASERMKEMGEYLVDALKASIDDHSTEANAESTEKKKGFNWPWVESGHTYDSITHRIITKKKK